MIESMTGFGRAERTDGHGTVLVEIRGVNGKYLKLQARLPDLLLTREAEVENLIRSRLSRGTVNVTVHLKMTVPTESYRMNVGTMRACAKALEQVRKAVPKAPAIRLEGLAALPGAMEPMEREDVAGEAWALTEGALQAALDAMLEMRRTEGRALAAILTAHLNEIEAIVGRIAERTPLVVIAWRDRFRERVRSLLADAGATVDDTDLAREVAFFAERSDIAEEVNRLKSHISHFRELLGAEASGGRTIEFLIQEMLRESSTIGAKANDTILSREVMALKAEIDRLREQIQNVA